MSATKSELVPIILIKEIMDQKRELERILTKHKVKEPEEIEKGIERGELPEHPSFLKLAKDEFSETYPFWLGRQRCRRFRIG
jgi:hypothetical protein